MWDCVFAVTTRCFDADESPLGMPLLHPHDHREALHGGCDSCPNCGKTSHFLRNCELPFTSAHKLMALKLGQSNDNGEAFRRWNSVWHNITQGLHLPSASFSSQLLDSLGPLVELLSRFPSKKTRQGQP